MNGDEKPTLKAWGEIQRLVATNAVHRKGFALSHLPGAVILHHAGAELAELKAADQSLFISDAQKRSAKLEEICDVFGCLFHYAQQQEFTPEEIDAELMRKLKLRFPTAYSEGMKE